MRISYKLLLIPLIAIMLSGCDKYNIVKKLKFEGSYTTLVSALEATGLDKVLADVDREFTVFAPTDEAFAKIDPAVLDSLINDPEKLSDILLYHVLADIEVDSSAAIAAAGTTVTTANTDEVGVALKDFSLFINASEVVEADIQARNGIIHAIDTVLLPTDDDPSSGNIAAVADSLGIFETLLGALTATGLDAVLTDSEGKFTVFAPTDAAFGKLDPDILSALTSDPNALRDVLLYHVIVDKEVNASAAIAIAGNTVEMGNTDDMALSLSGAELFANLSKIIEPNVDASNGIIHAIDTVLLPPDDTAASTSNIVEIAQGNSDFSTLVTALSATDDLVATLSGPGPFTVFAPTNDAFAAIPPATLNDLLATPNGTLRDILLKHVVAGSVDSVTAFTLNGADVPTVGGETVNLAIDSGEFTVDGALVTTFDIRASNGIIHVIDAVIQLD